MWTRGRRARPEFATLLSRREGRDGLKPYSLPLSLLLLLLLLLPSLLQPASSPIFCRFAAAAVAAAAARGCPGSELRLHFDRPRLQHLVEHDRVPAVPQKLVDLLEGERAVLVHVHLGEHLEESAADALGRHAELLRDAELCEGLHELRGVERVGAVGVDGSEDVLDALLRLAHDLMQQLCHAASPVITRGRGWALLLRLLRGSRGGRRSPRLLLLLLSSSLLGQHDALDADANRIATLRGRGRRNPAQRDPVEGGDHIPGVGRKGQARLRFEPPLRAATKNRSRRMRQ